MESQDHLHSNNAGYYAPQEEYYQYSRQFDENQNQGMPVMRQRYQHQFPPNQNVGPPMHMMGGGGAGMQRMPSQMQATQMEPIGQYVDDFVPPPVYASQNAMMYGRGAYHPMQPQPSQMRQPQPPTQGFYRRGGDQSPSQRYVNGPMAHHRTVEAHPEMHLPPQYMPRQAPAYVDPGHHGYYPPMPDDHQQHQMWVGYENAMPPSPSRHHSSHQKQQQPQTVEEEKLDANTQQLQDFKPDFGGNLQKHDTAKFDQAHEDQNQKQREFEKQRERAQEEANMLKKQKWKQQNNKQNTSDQRESSNTAAQQQNLKSSDNYTQDLKIDQMQQAIQKMQSQMQQLMNSYQPKNRTEQKREKSSNSRNHISTASNLKTSTPAIIEQPQFSQSGGNSDRSYNNSQQYPINALNYNRFHLPNPRNSRRDVSGSVPFIERQNSIANYRNHFFMNQDQCPQGRIPRDYQAPDPDYVSNFVHHTNHHEYSQIGQTSNVNHVNHEPSSVSNLTNYNYRGKFNIKSDSQSYYGGPMHQSIFQRGFNFAPQPEPDDYSQQINQEINKIISESASGKREPDNDSGKVQSIFSNQWENDVPVPDNMRKIFNDTISNDPPAKKERTRGFSVANNIFQSGASPMMNDIGLNASNSNKMGQPIDNEAGKQQRSQSFPDIQMARQYHLTNRGRQNSIYELHQIQEEKGHSISDKNSLSQRAKKQSNKQIGDCKLSINHSINQSNFNSSIQVNQGDVSKNSKGISDMQNTEHQQKSKYIGSSFGNYNIKEVQNSQRTNSVTNYVAEKNIQKYSYGQEESKQEEYDNSMNESSQKQDSEKQIDNLTYQQMKKISLFKKHMISNQSYAKLTQLDITNLATFHREFTLMSDKQFDKGGGLDNFIELYSKNFMRNQQFSFSNLYMYQIPKEACIILTTAQSQIEVQFEIKKENTGESTEFKRESMQFNIDLLEALNAPTFERDQQQFKSQKYKNGQVDVLYTLKINQNDKMKAMQQIKSQQQIDFKDIKIQIVDFYLIIENKNNSFKRQSNVRHRMSKKDSSENCISKNYENTTSQAINNETGKQNSSSQQQSVKSIDVKKERIQLQQKFQQELRDLQRKNGQQRYNLQKVNEDIASAQQRKAAFSFQAQRAFSVAASLNAKSQLALRELQSQSNKLSKEGKIEDLKANLVKPNLEYLKTRRMSTFANLTHQNLLDDCDSVSTKKSEEAEEKEKMKSQTQKEEKKENEEEVSLKVDTQNIQPIRSNLPQQVDTHDNQKPMLPILPDFHPNPSIQQHGFIPPVHVVNPVLQQQSNFNSNYQIQQPIVAPMSASLDQNQPYNNAQRIMMQTTDPKEVIAKILNKQGSKDFQKALTVTNTMSQAIKLEIENLVEFLVQKILEANDFQSLLIHQYGNYFCQKLFPRLKFDQKLKLIKELEKTKSDEEKPQMDQIPKEYYTRVNKCNSNFLWVAMNPKGTHSLQVFIENLEEEEFKLIISSLIQKENPLFFAFNKHATHVLIKFIELTTEIPYLQSIFEVLTKNFSALSMDANGLPLAKKLLAWIRTPSYKQNMINELSKNAIQLSQNAYGNYSLQVALDNWQVSECKEIFYNLQQDLQKLSVQKFSSNVIEKIIDTKDQETIMAYSKELNKPESLKALMKNQYGFYVLERILLQCDDRQVVQNMTTEIRKGLNQLLGNLDVSASGDPNYSNTNTSIQIRQKWHDLLEKIQNKDSGQQFSIQQPEFYPNQANMQQQPAPQYYGNMPNYKHMIPHQQVGPGPMPYRGGQNYHNPNYYGGNGKGHGGFVGARQYHNQNNSSGFMVNTSKPFNPNQKAYQDKSQKY